MDVVMSLVLFHQDRASHPGPLRGGERAWYTLFAHAHVRYHKNLREPFHLSVYYTRGNGSCTVNFTVVLQKI